MDELGKRLVSALIKERDIAPLNKFGITADLFLMDALPVFKWTIEYYTSNDSWPTAKQVEENTGISLPECTDSLDYVCNLVRKRDLGKSLESAIRLVVRDLEARKPDEALETLARSALVLQRSSTVRERTSSFRKTGPQRFQDYTDLKNSGLLRGIQTPWETLDKRLYGWLDGLLHVIIGVQNAGKTWAQCIIANDAFEYGYTVLFISMEMACVRIHRRLDAVRYKIPFADLLRTEVDLFSSDRWEKSLSIQVGGPGDILIADKKTVRQVPDVISLVREHSPDLVIIDGGYRFEGSAREGEWESSKRIVGELQTAAETTDIPWIVSSQQGKISASSKLKGQERAAKVKYAQEWVINPDVVLEMVQGDELRGLGQMEIHVLKVRDDPGDGNRDPVEINWDMEFMNFEEVSNDDTSVMY